MFSNNRMISGRQFQRLVVMDWFGKAMLLLTHISGLMDGAEYIVALAAGLIVVFVYGVLVWKLAQMIPADFYDYISERMGRGVAYIVSFLYFAYAFVNLIFLMRFFSAIVHNYILQEVPEQYFLILILPAAVYTANGGLEVRGRVSEILYPFLVYPVLFLLIFSLQSVEMRYLDVPDIRLDADMGRYMLRTVSAFGGMGIFLFAATQVEPREDVSRRLRNAILITGGIVLFSAVAVLGCFGRTGFRAQEWPLFALMSSADIPGGFVQRWDVLAVSFFIPGFLAAAGASLFYEKLLVEKVFQRRAGAWTMAALAAAAYIGALLCGSYQTAERMYRLIGGQMIIPAAMAVTMILFIIEWEKGKKKCRKRRK